MGQTLDDGSLANARLTNQDGIVFGASLQNLNTPPDLIIAANDRVELSCQRPLGEVNGVLFKGLPLTLGLG